jgi:hypothetical protein
MASVKLDIKRELRAVDERNYDFYDNLTTEEKKAFSPYILMRYTSDVQADHELQEWFLERTNEFVNKHHWVLSKNHKPLLWKLFAAVGIGQTFYHPYLANGKKGKADKIEKLLVEIYPAWKLEDIKLLASLMTAEEKKQLLENTGLDKTQQREYQ